MFFIFAVILIIYQRVSRRISINLWDKKLVQSNTYNFPCVLYTSCNKSYTNKEFVHLNSKILQRYSNIHGYTFKQFVHDDDYMSPYWLRVHDLLHLCKTTRDGTLIMYFDSDAIPICKDISIEAFIKSVSLENDRGADIYVSEDPQTQYDLIYKGLFNSGVFIVRNTSRAREIVQEWYNMYNSNFSWTKGNQGWMCRIYNRPCIWSFKGYEQYALSELYWKYPEVFLKLHWTTLACEDRSPHCFVMHLMGHSDESRKEIFAKELN